MVQMIDIEYRFIKYPLSIQDGRTKLKMLATKFSVLTFPRQTAVISRASSRSPCFLSILLFLFHIFIIISFINIFIIFILFSPNTFLILISYIGCSSPWCSSLYCLYSTDFYLIFLMWSHSSQSPTYTSLINYYLTHISLNLQEIRYLK